MDIKSTCLIGLSGATLVLAALPAGAANGLAVSQPEALWPQWQARIAVQTGSLSPVTLADRFGNAWGGNGAPRGLQGGAVFGDYYFARPSFGAFRASGGLLIGAQSGAPVFNSSNSLGSTRLDLSVNSLGNIGATALENPMATMPYVGLGFTGAAWRSLAITADVGVVAERPAGGGSTGRALLGNQGMDNALRDMRLSPVLQLGVRYTF